MPLARVTLSETVEFLVALDERPGDPIRDALAAGQFQYPPNMLSLLRWVRPGMVVVDAGAHIGTFSLAAAAFGARVLSFEALPANFAQLRESRDLNRFDRLEPLNRALGDREGTLEFFDAGPYGTQRYDAVPADQAGIVVASTTLDAELAARGIEHIDLVKIDIEGGELFALDGMQRLLSRPDAPVLFVESNGHALGLYHHTPSDLVARLESFGYSCYEILDRLRPFTTLDFQYDCVVDYLALKGSQHEAFAPLFGPGPSLDETLAGISRNVDHPSIHYRLYLVCALEDASPELRAHPAVVAALHRLCDDSYEETRERARRLLEGR
jgi:FkbM family methyltransferase